MKIICSSALLLLLSGCHPGDYYSFECSPVVTGGSWDSMQVSFRYKVIESEDASLVGQVFEDDSLVWHLSSSYGSGGILGYPPLASPLNQFLKQPCRGIYGKKDAIPPDGELVEFFCGEGGLAEIWLGVSELNEEGNPCGLYGHLIVWGLDCEDVVNCTEVLWHYVEMESMGAIVGGGASVCDALNGTRTTQWVCPSRP